MARLGIIEVTLSFSSTGETGNSFYLVRRPEAIQTGNDVSKHCQWHRLVTAGGVVTSHQAVLMFSEIWTGQIPGGVKPHEVQQGQV